MASTSGKDFQASDDFEARVSGIIDRKLRDWIDLPNEFKTSMTSWMELNPPLLPISQIVGFSTFTAQFAQVTAQESTTSLTYTDLGTGGPEITGLPDGRYLILYGAYMYNNTTGNLAWLAPKINTTEAADDDAAKINGITTPNVGASLARAVIKDLTNDGNNTVRLRYRVDGNTGTYGLRWLVTLRYANL